MFHPGFVDEVEEDINEMYKRRQPADVERITESDFIVDVFFFRNTNQLLSDCFVFAVVDNQSDDGNHGC